MQGTPKEGAPSGGASGDIGSKETPASSPTGKGLPEDPDELLTVVVCQQQEGYPVFVTEAYFLDHWVVALRHYHRRQDCLVVRRWDPRIHVAWFPAFPAAQRYPLLHHTQWNRYPFRNHRSWA